MAAIKRMAVYALALLLLCGGYATNAKAQVAYEPIIGQVFSGATMTVTPAVSADRRYVRLGVNAFFNDVNGFSTFSFPGAAVGGGNFGGVVGINAGMNGVIGDSGNESGLQVGNGMNPTVFGGQPNTLRAGPLPGARSGLGFGDQLVNDAGMNQAGEFGIMAGFDGDEAAQFFAMENGLRRGVRAASGEVPRSPRRSVRKSTKPTHRSSPAGRRKSR